MKHGADFENTGRGPHPPTKGPRPPEAKTPRSTGPPGDSGALRGEGRGRTKPQDEEKKKRPPKRAGL